MLKKRPAITLFITLAVIVAMLSLVGIIFSYLSEAKTKAQDKSALIESNLIYTDAINTLKNFLGKKPSKATLNNIYTVPLSIAQENGNFSMMIACLPSCAAIPITWLSNEQKSSLDKLKYNEANIVFEAITMEVRLKNPELLLSLITNTLDSKNQVNFGIEGRLKNNKNYLSYNKFKTILIEYNLQSGDNSVFDISWQNYFAFGEGCQSIDGDFLSSKLVSLLFNIDKQIVQEDFKSGYLKDFLLKNGGDMELYNSEIFAKSPLINMKCSINYTFASGNYKFSFKYKNGKVDSFEFN